MIDNALVRVNKRLPEDLLQGLEASAPQTSVRGIHPNWRVARYQAGQTFPAHQGQYILLFDSFHTYLMFLLRTRQTVLL